MDSGHPCIVDPRSTLGSRGSAPVLPTPETPFQLFEKGLIREGGAQWGGDNGGSEVFQGAGGGSQEWWRGKSRMVDGVGKGGSESPVGSWRGKLRMVEGGTGLAHSLGTHEPDWLMAFNQSTNQSINHSTNQAIEQPSNQATKRPIKQSTNQQTNKPTTSQPTKRSINQSTNQPINQSTNQPINQ